MKQRNTKQGGGVSVLFAMAAMSALASVSGAAIAQTNDSVPSMTMTVTPAPVRADEVGHSTLAWLDLQRSNTEAAPALPMLGAEAGLAYRRYMESFRSKIPDLYGSALKAGGVGDAGGGGAAQGSGGSGAN